MLVISAELLMLRYNLGQFVCYILIHATGTAGPVIQSAQEQAKNAENAFRKSNVSLVEQESHTFMEAHLYSSSFHKRSFLKRGGKRCAAILQCTALRKKKKKDGRTITTLDCMLRDTLLFRSSVCWHFEVENEFCCRNLTCITSAVRLPVVRKHYFFKKSILTLLCVQMGL